MESQTAYSAPYLQYFRWTRLLTLVESGAALLFCLSSSSLFLAMKFTYLSLWFKILTLDFGIQAAEMPGSLHFEVFLFSTCKFNFILHLSPAPGSVSLTKENQFRYNVDSNVTLAPCFFVKQSLRTHGPSRCRPLHYTTRYYAAASHLVFLHTYLLRSV